MLGTIMPGDKGYIPVELERTNFKDTPIPDSFDARTAFPQCAAIIGHVRDQSKCGACYYYYHYIFSIIIIITIVIIIITFIRFMLGFWFY